MLPPRLARNLAASTQICQVLFLQLDQLRLELLGLIVEIPERVTLRVTADSNGGVLGSLFCRLANLRVDVRGLSSAARELTKAAQTSGLATSGVSFTVPLGASAAAQEATCEILDLILGPLDLQLLGLRVQLGRVHLTITAERDGGVLGSLFCALAEADVPLPVP